MATRNKPVKTAEAAPVAAKKAPKFAGKQPSVAPETEAAAPEASAKPAKPAKNAPVAAPAPASRGRAPLDGKFLINVEAAGTRVKRGFTRDYLDAALALQKASRGKGFQLSELFGQFPDKSRAQLMDCHYACTERSVYAPA